MAASGEIVIKMDPEVRGLIEKLIAAMDALAEATAEATAANTVMVEAGEWLADMIQEQPHD